MSVGRPRSTLRTQLCSARDRLREPGERIHLTAIARQAHLSTGELIRRFAAFFGETPHQFRVRERIETAKRLLARGDMSVTDVCMEVGFSSVGSFSALFARRVGVSPSAYRARVHALTQHPASSPASLQPGCISLLAGALATPAYAGATRSSAISEKR